MTKVAVIGAGITGVTTAYYLIKQGFDVVIIDQEPHIAMRTSYANGGQVSVSNSEVWNTWSNVLKGLKWLTKKDAPLLIRPSLDPDKLLWILRFLKNTANNSYAKNTIATIEMGLHSRNLYQEIINDTGIEFDQSNSGILHFYKDPVYWDKATKAQKIYQDNGCEWNLVNVDEIHHIEPNLHLGDIIGGAWTPSDWTGDIHKFCYELTKKLIATGKLCFVSSLEINDINLWLDEYHYIVVCSGVGSVKLAKSIGDSLPIYPVKGYSVTIDLGDSGEYAPKVSLLDDQAKIVTARLGNRLRVAGTAELAGENYDIRYDRVKPLLNWVRSNFSVDTSNYNSWACLRPMTPNMLPITKQSDKISQVFYNTGHGHLGWTLAPYTANKVTNMILLEDLCKSTKKF